MFYSASDSRKSRHIVSLALTVVQRLFTAIYIAIYTCLSTARQTTSACLMLTFMLPPQCVCVCVRRGLCKFSCIIEHIRARCHFSHIFTFFPPRFLSTLRGVSPTGGIVLFVLPWRMIFALFTKSPAQSHVRSVIKHLTQPTYIKILTLNPRHMQLHFDLICLRWIAGSFNYSKI